MKITIKYSCHLCMLKNIELEVPARGEKEDVVTWVKSLGYYMADDHDKRSPHCHPEELKDIMIPIEGSRRIGEPPMN